MLPCPGVVVGISVGGEVQVVVHCNHRLGEGVVNQKTLAVGAEDVVLKDVVGDTAVGGEELDLELPAADLQAVVHGQRIVNNRAVVGAAYRLGIAAGRWKSQVPCSDR